MEPSVQPQSPRIALFPVSPAAYYPYRPMEAPLGPGSSGLRLQQAVPSRLQYQVLCTPLTPLMFPTNFGIAAKMQLATALAISLNLRRPRALMVRSTLQLPQIN